MCRNYSSSLSLSVAYLSRLSWEPVCMKLTCTCCDVCNMLNDLLSFTDRPWLLTDSRGSEISG